MFYFVFFANPLRPINPFSLQCFGSRICFQLRAIVVGRGLRLQKSVVAFGSFSHRFQKIVIGVDLSSNDPMIIFGVGGWRGVGGCGGVWWLMLPWQILLSVSVRLAHSG